MAIVDKTHSLTIEELVSKIGTGGGETPTGPTPKWSFEGTFADLVNRYPIQVGTFNPGYGAPTFYHPYIVLSDDYIGDEGDYVVFGDAELASDSGNFTNYENAEYAVTWFELPVTGASDEANPVFGIFTNRNNFLALKSFGIDEKLTVLTPYRMIDDYPTTNTIYSSEEAARALFTNLATAMGDKPFNIAVYDKSTSLPEDNDKIKIAKFTSTYKDNVTTYSCDMSFAKMVDVFNNGGVVIGVSANRYAIFEPVIMDGPDPYYFMFKYDYYDITGTSVNIHVDRINVYNNGDVSNSSEYVTVTGTK